MLADYWQNQTNQWVTLPIDYEKQKMFLPIFRYTFFCIPLFNLTGKLGKYFAEINKAQVLLQVIFFFFFFSFSSSSLGDTKKYKMLRQSVRIPIPTNTHIKNILLTLLLLLRLADGALVSRGQNAVWLFIENVLTQLNKTSSVETSSVIFQLSNNHVVVVVV